MTIPSTPQELLDECAKELRYAAQYAMDHNVNLSGARAMARRVEEFLASFPLSETKTNSSPNDAIWPPEMELQSMAGGGFQRVKYIRADLVQSERRENPDVVAQVEKALRKNPLIAMFLDQGFWHAHHVDIVIRHDGQDRRYEADWIVDLWYIVRRRGLSATDAVVAAQEAHSGEGVSGGQSDPR